MLVPIHYDTGLGAYALFDNLPLELLGEIPSNSNETNVKILCFHLLYILNCMFPHYTNEIAKYELALFCFLRIEFRHSA